MSNHPLSASQVSEAGSLGHHNSSWHWHIHSSKLQSTGNRERDSSDSEDPADKLRCCWSLGLDFWQVLTTDDLQERWLVAPRTDSERPQ